MSGIILFLKTDIPSTVAPSLLRISKIQLTLFILFKIMLTSEKYQNKYYTVLIFITTAVL